MFKRIASLALVIALLFSVTVFADFNDVQSDTEYSDAIDRLVQYGILSGKENGNFDPDGCLTRAEMAKISSIVTGHKDEAAANAGISLYSDLEDSHWASGYINIASKNSLILGYPDGTYLPEKDLTFAEAVTIVLRMLDYSADDLGNNWPYAYTAKAFEIALTDGLYYGDYDLISRKDMALILDRALLTDTNSGTSSSITDSTSGNEATGSSNKKLSKLVEKMDYSISDECIVLATKSENKNLLSDEIVTTLGTYKKLNNNADKYLTRKVKLILNQDGKIANVMPISQTGMDIIVESVVGDELAYSEKGKNSSLKLNNSSIIYYQGSKTNFSSFKDLVQTGMTATVYLTPNGEYEYAVIKEFDILGPYIMTADLTGGETSIGGNAINKNGLRVIRDGYEAQLSDIKMYDVVYYNNISNIIYSYIDKVSGVYEKASPSKANVTKIMLSGKEYSIETQSAVKQLGDNPGSFQINDYITLLLGKDGQIAGVVGLNSVDTTSYGIILSCGERLSDKKENEGTKEYYINVFTATGTEQTFTTDRDYTDYRGRLIKYNFNNGILTPNFVNGNKIEGKVDVKNKKIGSYSITDDTKIIDLTYAPAIDESAPAAAEVIELSDIPLSTLEDFNVIHAQIDTKFGELQFIILNNVTMGKYQFGVITNKEGSNYTIDINGTQKAYNTNIKNLQEGQPVMASIQNNSLTELKQLNEINPEGKLIAVDIQKIKFGDTDYKLSPNAVAYKCKDFKYMLVPIDDLSKYSIKNIRIFADKSIENGGLIRVIMFSE